MSWLHYFSRFPCTFQNRLNVHERRPRRCKSRETRVTDVQRHQMHRRIQTSDGMNQREMHMRDTEEGVEKRDEIKDDRIRRDKQSKKTPKNFSSLFIAHPCPSIVYPWEDIVALISLIQLLLRHEIDSQNQGSGNISKKKRQKRLSSSHEKGGKMKMKLQENERKDYFFPRISLLFLLISSQESIRCWLPRIRNDRRVIIDDWDK